MKKTQATIVATPTDLEKEGLKGPVKSIMQTAYKAHLRSGQIIQGKIESNYSFGSKNFIISYNEKGAKVHELFFGTECRKGHVFNDKGQLTEIIDYDTKDGSLKQRNTFTYNEKGGMLANICYKPDGSLIYQVLTTY